MHCAGNPPAKPTRVSVPTMINMGRKDGATYDVGMKRSVLLRALVHGLSSVVSFLTLASFFGGLSPKIVVPTLTSLLP